MISIYRNSGSGIDFDSITIESNQVVKGRYFLNKEGKIQEGSIYDNTSKTIGKGPLYKSKNGYYYKDLKPEDVKFTKIYNNINGILLLPPEGNYKVKESEKLDKPAIYVSICIDNNPSVFGSVKKSFVLKNKTFVTSNSDPSDPICASGTMNSYPKYKTVKKIWYNNNNISVNLDSGAYISPSYQGSHEVIAKVSDLNLDRSSIASDRSILGITGTIPVVNGDSNYKSIATRNSMSLFTNHPDKHRRIIIPVNKSLYRCDYVAGICDDLRPENIRLGKTIAGVKGTMKDYSSGRVVFENGKFDGTLIGGICGSKDGNIKIIMNSRHSSIVASLVPSLYDYQDQCRHYGYELTSENITLKSARYVGKANDYVYGCEGPIFKSSINLITFRQIKIDYSISGFIDNRKEDSEGYSTNNAEIEFNIYIFNAKHLKKVKDSTLVVQKGFGSGFGPVDSMSWKTQEPYPSVVEKDNYYKIDGIYHQFETRNPNKNVNYNGSYIMDISNINWQAFIGFSFYITDLYTYYSYFSFNIKRIQFIN